MSERTPVKVINPGEPVIEVRGVSLRFRVIQERPDTLREAFTKLFRQRSEFHIFEAVRNVSFNVHPGETLGIIGRNGSGKSSLLKMIAGVFQPSTGAIAIKGTLAPLIELGAGFHGELTGRENILMNGLLMGFSAKEMREREQRIIEFADIGDFIDSPIKQYSSGMYSRLAFAVATEVDPDILVVDEILSVGDMAFQEKSFARLEEFRKSGKTILLVSHSTDDILDHCSRAIYLQRGQIVADGEPSKVVEMYVDDIMPGHNAHQHEHQLA